MSALRPPRANVPAQRMYSGRMHSPPRGITKQKAAMRPLAKLLWTAVYVHIT